jgi:hypothetical protein
MSVTLFCLIQGNLPAVTHAFPVKVSKDETIGELKDAIKEKSSQSFAGIDAKDIKLWKVEIPDDHYDELSNISFQDQDELLPTKKISKYFPDSPAEEHIHVIVEQPVSTATSSQEVFELREKLVSLQALLNKSVYGMCFK